MAGTGGYAPKQTTDPNAPKTGGGDFPAIPNDPGPIPGLVREMARWEELQRKLAEGDRLTAKEYEEIVFLDRRLEALRKDDPSTFDKVSSALTTLERSRGGNGIPGGIMDGSSAFANSFSSSERITRTAQSDTKQLTTRYVDLPTPDEFLDDFENSYNIHITGLVQTGAISPAVAQFARENAGNVFGEYLREQTARLLKGEPLWRVVGQNADNQLIGRRTGEFAETETEQAENIQRNISESQSTTASGGAVTRAQEEAAARLQQQPTAATQVTETAAQSPAGQAVESSTSTGTSTEDTLSKEKSRFTQDEALVSRNRLGYVSNLAPLDFLKNSASAQRLNLLYGGQKGLAVREQQTAAGQTRVQARRV